MRIILVGFGVVGSGVVEVLSNYTAEIERRYESIPKVVAICDSGGSLVNEKGISLEKAYSYSKAKSVRGYPGYQAGLKAIDVIRQVDADIMVELTPTSIETGEPGTSHMKAAIERGMHVVTSNKGPLALYFDELTKAAKKNGLLFRYEATVGGAMPVFNLIRNCMHVNPILSVRGILNGTTNYILSRMYEEGQDYASALAAAQAMGIAESDPTYDVEGIDAACKVAILGNAIFGKKMTVHDVKRTGITGVKAESVDLAKEKGFIIKLIAFAGDEFKVEPTLVPINHPLAVKGTLNILEFQTGIAKEILVAGRGAGHEETASAVIGDILEIYRETCGHL